MFGELCVEGINGFIVFVCIKVGVVVDLKCFWKGRLKENMIDVFIRFLEICVKFVIFCNVF